jgi:hypothetical protein
MACRGAANTKGAYLAAMMGGGGGTTTGVVGEVATEDEGDEGLGGAEVLIRSLVAGDKTSGVRGCTTVGSKMSLDTKVSDRVLTRFRSGKGSRSIFVSYLVLREKERDLFFGVLLAELEMKAFRLNNCSGLSNAAEGSGSG